jgi:hypothetical protein
MKRVAIACVVLVSLVACRGEEESPTVSSAVTTTTTAAPLTGFGTTRVATPSPDDEFFTRVVALRLADHGQFVRVVFEFDEGVPPYVVEPASPPFVQDGSGDDVHVAGTSFLTIRLDQTAAHTEDGSPTLGAARTAGPGGGPVTELVRLGDFEGVVNFVLGMKTARPFRVTNLQSPPRLVVDVAA